MRFAIHQMSNKAETTMDQMFFLTQIVNAAIKVEAEIMPQKAAARYRNFL